MRIIRKKIVDYKCYLSHCEIVLQKIYLVTKISHGNDMRSLLNLLALLFKFSILDNNTRSSPELYADTGPP